MFSKIDLDAYNKNMKLKSLQPASS